MQFISLFMFALICGYSLVLSAPVEQKVPDSPETKQQKATAIASRLLKELAHEQQESHKKEEAPLNEDEQVVQAPVDQPEVEKVTSQFVNEDDNNDVEDIDILPIIGDLYETYGDNYNRVPVEEDSSSDFDENDIYPLIRKQLLRYLAAQELANAHLNLPQNSDVMDDRLMAAEDH